MSGFTNIIYISRDMCWIAIQFLWQFYSYHKIWLQCFKYDSLSHLLTDKLLEMHECILSTVATDALVLKHQDINTHIAD